MVVFGLGKDVLFKSVLVRCDLPTSSCPRSYWTTPYSSSEVTTSPFRQSEWDCRLDHLLQDLETSVEAQRSQSSERTNNNNISKSNQKVQIEVEDIGEDTTADTGLRHVVFLHFLMNVWNEFEMSLVSRNFVVHWFEIFLKKTNPYAFLVLDWCFSTLISMTNYHHYQTLLSFF